MADENKRSEVDFVSGQFDKALERSQTDRSEAVRMRNLFTGFGKGQWDTDSKARLSSRGNITPQINLSREKIERLAGSIIKNFFDVNFIPSSSKETDLTRIVNDLFVSDSNTFNYAQSYLDCVVDGLIHQGVEQMVCSTRYNPLGNIVFERVMPGHVIIDPNWRTNDAWDIQEVFKIAYLTADQIKNIYGTKNERITQILDSVELNGIAYDDDEENKSTAHVSLNAMYGGKYRVIERHYLELETRVVKFAKVGDEMIDLPDDEVAANEQLSFLAMTQTVGDVITRRVTDRVYKVCTICKELDPIMPLQSGKSDMQIGRLPFFPFSSNRYGGTNSGVMSKLEDVQKLINSREAQVDDIIASSSSAASLYDPMLFGNNEALIAQAVENFKRPDAMIRTASGMLASYNNMIKPITRQQFPGELYQEINRIAGYFDSLSGQTSTLDGMKESSHDTGVLFRQRAVQSEIALTTLTKRLESHVKDKAESWMLYSKILYSGAYREVSKVGKDNRPTGENIEVNKREYKENGDVVVYNDLSQLPRHKVIVVPSKDGLSVREADLARNLELLQYVQSPIKRVQIEQAAMEAINTSSKEKAEMREYNDLELAVAVANMELQLANAKAQVQQIQAQTQQMQAQTQAMQQQGAMPQEGAPQEQAPEEMMPQ